MIRFCFLVTLVALAGCTPALLFKDTIPDLSPEPSQALVVYMRTVDMPEFSFSSFSTGPYGGSSTMISSNSEGVESRVYVDERYVGGTKSSTLTSFSVEPGEHIISACANFCGKMKLVAKPGRVYYIEEIPIPMGPLGQRLNIQCIDADEARQKIEENDYRYSRPNPENREEDRDPEDVHKLLEDWDEWAEDHPEDARKELQCTGEEF